MAKCEKWLQLWCDCCKVCGHTIGECGKGQRSWFDHHKTWGHAAADCRDRKRYENGGFFKLPKRSSRGHSGAVSDLKHQPTVTGNMQSSLLTEPGTSGPRSC